MDLPYFGEYPKDWLGDTGHLSFAEKGVYHDLRCLLCETSRARVPSSLGRPKPCPAPWLVKEWRKYRAILVEGEFPMLEVDQDGRLYDRRLLRAYERSARKSATNRRNQLKRWYPEDTDEDTTVDTTEYKNVDTNVSNIVSTTYHTVAIRTGL